MGKDIAIGVWRFIACGMLALATLLTVILLAICSESFAIIDYNGSKLGVFCKLDCVGDQCHQACEGFSCGPKEIRFALQWMRVWNLIAALMSALAAGAVLFGFRPDPSAGRASAEYSMWPFFLVMWSIFSCIAATTSVVLLQNAVDRTGSGQNPTIDPAIGLNIGALIASVIAAVPVVVFPLLSVQRKDAAVYAKGKAIVTIRRPDYGGFGYGYGGYGGRYQSRYQNPYTNPAPPTREELKKEEAAKEEPAMMTGAVPAE